MEIDWFWIFFAAAFLCCGAALWLALKYSRPQAELRNHVTRSDIELDRPRVSASASIQKSQQLAWTRYSQIRQDTSDLVGSYRRQYDDFLANLDLQRPPLHEKLLEAEVEEEVYKERRVYSRAKRGGLGSGETKH